MDPLIALAVVGVALLVAISRSSYHLVGPEIAGSDSYGHKVQVRAFRRNGFRIPDKIPQSIFDMEFANPYLLPLAVSVVPERWWPALDRHFSALMDLLLLVVLIGAVWLDFLDGAELVVAAALLFLTPQLMRRDLAHGRGISARKPGMLLTTVSLLAFSYWTVGGSTLALVVAVAVGALVPISSRFSTQAFAFLCVGIGFLADHRALLLFAAAILASIVVSRGFAWKILRSHLRFLHDYAVHKQYGRLYDGWKSLDTLGNFVTARSPRQVFQAIYESILPLGVLNNPHVVPSLAIIAFTAWAGTGTEVPPALSAWVVAGVATFLLTSVYHLRFLGQPGRYLEYVLLPSVVVTATVVQDLGARYQLLVGATGAVGAAMIAGYLWMHLEFYEGTTDEALEEVLEFLGTLEPSVVLTRYRDHGARIAWATDHSVSDYLGNRFTSEDSREQFRRLYPGLEEFLTDDVAWIRETFDPDFVLFDTPRAIRDGELAPPDADPLFSNDQFEVYDFDDFE